MSGSIAQYFTGLDYLLALPMLLLTLFAMGILLIDHNVRRVVRMSDRVCVLSLGRITAQGDAAEFQGNLHQQVQEWLGLHF